jgi:hypothetical protein
MTIFGSRPSSPLPTRLSPALAALLSPLALAVIALAALAMISITSLDTWISDAARQTALRPDRHTSIGLEVCSPLSRTPAVP